MPKGESIFESRFKITLMKFWGEGAFDYICQAVPEISAEASILAVKGITKL